MIYTSNIYVMFYFFNNATTTEIYTLSLHDALPILSRWHVRKQLLLCMEYYISIRVEVCDWVELWPLIRSEEHTSELQHANISYAVFCLKKKNIKISMKQLLRDFNGIRGKRAKKSYM